MNPLRELHQFGQAVWLDYIRRGLMESGELQRLVDEDDLCGVTSNPTIFEKAIAGSTDYDEALRARLQRELQDRPAELYEALAVEDIRRAADVLAPVYRATGGGDGYVSLEVSPRLALDTEGTVAEARRLWAAVGKPNLMIKVPATSAGAPAIETLIADGINVNVTLIFSVAQYEPVAQAYLRGLARWMEGGGDPRRVASVASLFVSRVDTAADRALETVGRREAQALRGKVAIANAKQVYQRFVQLFYGDAFAALKGRRARVQRVLWASTSTKSPRYSDVLYVEELIGPDTVNTMSPATLNAFREHGRVRARTVEEGLEEAKAVIGRLGELGIDLDALTERLQGEGVASFAESFEKLMRTLQERRSAILAGRVARQTLRLGSYQASYDARVQTWEETDVSCRLWRKDPTLWSPQPVPELTDRLGWLTQPAVMHEQVEDLVGFAEEIRDAGFRHAVLLGMGGSSLAPEVFQSSFGNASGYPELLVLDSTHPAAVRALERGIDLERTLFLVSSKSGTTTETLCLFDYFWDRASQSGDAPGSRFVAITDPGTSLEALAHEREFRRVWSAPADVGGRYSALTVFGLVPAALIGVDVHRLLDRALTMAEACASCVPVRENPGLELGAALGELARSGRDKATFLLAPSTAAFCAWVEQLIAESSGKDGKGILPVVGESPGRPEVYGEDRVFVDVRMDGEAPAELDGLLEALESKGHPVIAIRLAGIPDLGQEFFRWEVAIAAAGAVLEIHPFNQPDVQLAKDVTRQVLGEFRRSGRLSEAEAVAPDDARALQAFFREAGPGGYVALQAYLAPSKETTAALEDLRTALRDRLRVAATLGYGPRFLHSTGQFHKGGPNAGLFLQLTDDPPEDAPLPGHPFTFGTLIRAQALGDYRALEERGRRVLRVNLGKDVVAGLQRVRNGLHG